MNLSLLQLVGKWLSLVVVSLASFVHTGFYREETRLSNNNVKKNGTIINRVVEYDTELKYSEKYPTETKRTIVEGQDGVSYYNEESGMEKMLKPVVDEVILVGTGDKGDYTGRMTGYGPDCEGCSKVGNVACFTKERTNHSLIFDGIYYEDEEFGKVRILSAARDLFPCGTIIKVDNSRTEPFYGVVLDTGGSMINAWAERSEVWLDLAYASQADAAKGNTSGRNVSYQVQRWGW